MTCWICNTQVSLIRNLKSSITTYIFNVKSTLLCTQLLLSSSINEKNSQFHGGHGLDTRLKQHLMRRIILMSLVKLCLLLADVFNLSVFNLSIIKIFF